MFYSPDVKKALSLAYRAHANQYDICGTPFIYHPLYVAMKVPDHDDSFVVVALLHDVLEKTELTVDDLIEAGFSSHIIDTIKLLTYNREEPYLEYIQRIKQNPLARTVAIHAIYHNLDTERYKDVNFTAEQMDRLEELQEAYEDAYRILADKRQNQQNLEDDQIIITNIRE